MGVVRRTRTWGSEGKGRLGKRAEAGQSDMGPGRRTEDEEWGPRAGVKGDLGWILGPMLEQNWGSECRGQRGWG